MRAAIEREEESRQRVRRTLQMRKEKLLTNDLENMPLRWLPSIGSDGGTVGWVARQLKRRLSDQARFSSKKRFGKSVFLFNEISVIQFGEIHTNTIIRWWHYGAANFPITEELNLLKSGRLLNVFHKDLSTWIKNNNFERKNDHFNGDDMNFYTSMTFRRILTVISVFSWYFSIKIEHDI